MTQPEIEAFLAVIQQGTVTAAAESLYITQPALSRRLRALEGELGCALFERGKGSRFAALTREGEAFVAVADKLRHVYREAREISGLERAPVFSLSSIGSVSTYLLPRVLQEFVSGPNGYHLSFHLHHSYEAYRHVESGMTDLAIISDDMFSRETVTTPLFREPFVLACGADWSGAGPVSPKELDPRREVRLPWNPEFDIWHGRWFDAAASPIVCLDQMSLMEEFLTGENFAVVPLTVARRLRRGEIRVFPLRDGPEDRMIYSVTRPASPRREMMAHFLSLLRRELAGIDGVEPFLGPLP